MRQFRVGVTVLPPDGPGFVALILTNLIRWTSVTTSNGSQREKAVNNLAPVVGAITAPTSPIKVSTIVNTSANFTDPGVVDTHTAVWNWGDGSTSPGIMTESNGSGSVTGSHSYTKPGLYTILLTATDKDGTSGQSTFQTLIVYNPQGGFVTGGGWFNSPLGAYRDKPTKKGQAVIAFVVKYLKNVSVPPGSLDFIFPAGSLQFKATTFDWLVVDQTNKTAQFQSSGKINGSGNYNFMIWQVTSIPILSESRFGNRMGQSCMTPIPTCLCMAV